MKKVKILVLIKWSYRSPNCVDPKPIMISIFWARIFLVSVLRCTPNHIPKYVVLELGRVTLGMALEAQGRWMGDGAQGSCGRLNLLVKFICYVQDSEVSLWRERATEDHHSCSNWSLVFCGLVWGNYCLAVPSILQSGRSARLGGLLVTAVSWVLRAASDCTRGKVGMEEELEKAATLIKDAKSVVAFTGAGISVESGM